MKDVDVRGLDLSDKKINNLEEMQKQVEESQE